MELTAVTPAPVVSLLIPSPLCVLLALLAPSLMDQVYANPALPTAIPLIKLAPAHHVDQDMNPTQEKQDVFLALQENTPAWGYVNLAPLAPTLPPQERDHADNVAVDHKPSLTKLTVNYVLLALSLLPLPNVSSALPTPSPPMRERALAYSVGPVTKPRRTTLTVRNVHRVIIPMIMAPANNAPQARWHQGMDQQSV